MGIDPGNFPLARLHSIRMSLVDKKNTEQAKKARKRRRRVRKGLEDELAQAEQVPYGAGIADERSNLEYDHCQM